MSADTPKLKAPYGSYPSIKNFIGGLAKTVYPPHIDRDMMAGMSGQTQSEVTTALRFLGGIDGNNNTKGPLKKLVDAYGTDSWQKVLRGATETAYAPVVALVDITAGSAKQLQSAFKAYTSADGFMLTRHVRFYLSILKDAGVEYSPHFKVPKAQKSAANGAKKKAAKKSAKGRDKPLEETEKEEEKKDSEGTQRYPLYFKGKPKGALIVPENLSLADCKVIELQLKVLRAYAGEDVE